MPGHRHLLLRRHRRTGELAYYRCYTPRPIPLTALVKAAGRRWTVGLDFTESMSEGFRKEITRYCLILRPRLPALGEHAALGISSAGCCVARCWI